MGAATIQADGGTKVAMLFPGQGSQYVGMGRDLYEAHGEVRQLFSRASEVVGFDLAAVCFQGPEEVLVKTEIVQPAITLINLACLLVCRQAGLEPAVVAGHSLGEYSALYAAGVLDEATTFRLVRLRGQYMQEAADQAPGSMAALINLAEEKIEKICASCGIEIANFNSPAQVIVSGPTPAVERAMELATAAGAKRCVRLPVSGPWHSRAMEPARQRFAEVLAEAEFHPPRVPLVANVDADYLQGAEQARSNLERQLCAPVLWRQSMERLLAAGYRTFVEVGPKKVLCGLMRQIDRKAAAYNVEGAATLEDCLARLGKR